MGFQRATPTRVRNRGPPPGRASEPRHEAEAEGGTFHLPGNNRVSKTESGQLASEVEMETQNKPSLAAKKDSRPPTGREKLMTFNRKVVPGLLMGITLLVCPLGTGANAGSVQQELFQTQNISTVYQSGGQARSEVEQVGSGLQSTIQQEKGVTLASVYQTGNKLKSEIYQYGLGDISNQANIRQEGSGLRASITEHGMGNVAEIKQSGGAFSSPQLNSKYRAEIDQYGDLNYSLIDQLGWGQIASITQGCESMPSVGNVAIIRQLNGTGSQAYITQMGESNTASLTQTASNTFGWIDQAGSQNQANLNLNANGAKGGIVQKGDSNTANLTMNVALLLPVTISQVGSNITTNLTFSK